MGRLRALGEWADRLAAPSFNFGQWVKSERGLSDGTLAEAYESGLLSAIAGRARELTEVK